jgi:hypothetical protein
MIDNLSRDELLDDVDMTVMNGVECPAVKPNAQCVLLIEAKNDVQKECKDAKCDKSECVWRNWKFAGSFFSEFDHGVKITTYLQEVLKSALHR